MKAITIVDWKTSVSKQKVWQLQISGAYRILAEENGYKPVIQCLALRLDVDGGPAIANSYGDLMDTAYFLRGLDIWRFFHPGDEIPRASDILSPHVDSAWFTETDRERGQVVHKACAGIAKGLWVPTLKLYKGYVKSFQLWFEANIEEVLLVEERLVSQLGFTGQPDLICRMK